MSKAAIDRLEKTKLYKQLLKLEKSLDEAELSSKIKAIVNEASDLLKRVPDNMPEYTLHDHEHSIKIVEIMGVIALFGYLNRWNDSMGTQLEDGAIESGRTLLKNNGWTEGKHSYV